MAWLCARIAAIGLAGVVCGSVPNMASAQCYGLWAQVELGSQTGHAMVYDSTHGRVILHCAGTGDGGSGGTWAWDGVAWTRLSFDGPWPQRTNFAMAYDSARDRVVLFGGTGPKPANQSLGDTWEFDGTHWRLLDATGTPARSKGSMVYDDARGTVLLLGGSTVSGSAMDLWEWDGLHWAVIPASGAPSQGNAKRAMVAYDSARDRLVVVPDPSIGSTEGTWTFANGQWSQALSTAPHSTYARSATYDAARDRVVLLGGSWLCPGSSDQGESSVYEFNGQTWSSAAIPFQKRTFLPIVYDANRGTSMIFGGSQSGCTYSPPLKYSETWEWSGSAWAQWADPRPPARTTTAGTFSGSLGAAVVFSGVYTSCYGEGCGDFTFRDTWTWDASGWTDASAGVQPAQRKFHAMAYDALRERVVLFAGEAFTSPDTWLFDGAWTQVPGAGPPYQTGHSLAYDPLRDRTVMVGSQGTTIVWELDDTVWSDRTPSGPSPARRPNAALAFDPVRGELLYFGGGDANTSRNDTWAWNGQLWTQLSPVGPLPAPRYGHMMSTDSDRGVVLMSGSGGSPDLGDTWEWNGAGWTQVGSNANLPTPGSASMMYDTVRHATYRFALDAFWQWVPARTPCFVEDPADTITTVTNPAILQCLTEAVGPATFQWRKDGVPLVDDGRVRGSHTMRLVIEQAVLDDTGSYDVVCTGGCGAVTSAAATLTVYCPADFDQNGFVNGDDFDTFSFLFYWGDPEADFDGNGFVNGDDFDYFSIYFEAGC